MIDILLKGTKNLNLMREKWSQLVAFFKMTSNMLGSIDKSVNLMCTHGNTVVQRRYIIFTPTNEIVGR